MEGIEFKIKPNISNQSLNELFHVSWPDFKPRNFSPVLSRSYTYICAYEAENLIGFINIAWDGDKHTFLLDTTVHSDYRKRGIGTQLVLQGIEESKKSGAEWMHVDYEAKLDHFYKNCGFFETKAGLVNLNN